MSKTQLKSSDEGPASRKGSVGSGPAALITFSGHAGLVSELALSNSGNLLLSASTDSTVKMWDTTQEGKLVRTFEGHEAAVQALLWVGEHTFWSGGEDGSIRIWDTSHSKCTSVLREHTGTVWCLAMAPEGDIVYSGGGDKVIRTWSKDGKSLPVVLKGHTKLVWCLLVAGDQIFSGSDDNTVRIWNPKGKCLNILEGHEGMVSCLDFQDGTLYSGSLDSTIRVWDKSGKNTNIINLQGLTGWIWDLQVEGNSIYCGGRYPRIQVCEKTSGTPTHTFEGHLGAITSLLVDGDTIFSGSWDCSARVWKEKTRNWKARLQKTGTGSGIGLDALAARYQSKKAGHTDQ